MLAGGTQVCLAIVSELPHFTSKIINILKQHNGLPAKFAKLSLPHALTKQFSLSFTPSIFCTI